LAFDSTTLTVVALSRPLMFTAALFKQRN